MYRNNILNICSSYTEHIISPQSIHRNIGSFIANIKLVTMDRIPWPLLVFLAMLIGLCLSTDKRGRSKLSSKHHVLRMQGKKLDPISGKVRTIGKRSGTIFPRLQ